MQQSAMQALEDQAGPSFIPGQASSSNHSRCFHAWQTARTPALGQVRQNSQVQQEAYNPADLQDARHLSAPPPEPAADDNQQPNASAAQPDDQQVEQRVRSHMDSVSQSLGDLKERVSRNKGKLEDILEDLNEHAKVADQTQMTLVELQDTLVQQGTLVQQMQDTLVQQATLAEQKHETLEGNLDELKVEMAKMKTA